MFNTYKLGDSTMDFTPYISGHSADEVVTYKKHDGKKLKLGFYFPDNYNKGKKYPIFMFIHGGGWTASKIFSDQSGWSGDYLGFLARYYSKRGFISVSIDYRLMNDRGQTDEYKLPDLVVDCIDALGFLKDHDYEYGIDFSRSVLLGESAGGYLAAALTTFKHKYNDLIKKSILVNAITDMTDGFWGQYIPKELNDNLSYTERKIHLSPLHHIGKHCPEVLLLHGFEDGCVYPRHSIAFYDEMRIQKLPVSLHMFYDITHAFLLAEFMTETKRPLSACEKSIEIIDEFVNSFLN